MNLYLPYSSHESFHSKKKYYSYEHEEFNQLYDEVLHSKSLDRKKNDSLLKSLDLIFKNLLEQETKKRKVNFLKELWKFSRNILRDDISYYSNNHKDINYLKKKYIKFKLNDYTLKKIQNIIIPEVQKFRDNVDNNKLRRTDLQKNSGIKIYKICQILNKELSNTSELAQLNKYMGGDYEITGCSLELSSEKSTWWRDNFLNDYEQPKTLYYHFDENIKYPKAIFYLSDVEKDNGCFSFCENFSESLKISPIQKIIGRAIHYVGKSEKSELNKLYNQKYHQIFSCDKFREDFSSLPDELKFNSHFGNDVIPSSNLEKFILKNEKNLEGNKGTGLIFDGSELLHRGGLIQSGERLVLQAIFGKKQKFKLIKKLLFKIFKIKIDD